MSPAESEHLWLQAPPQIHFSGSGNQGPGKYTFACSTPDEEVQGIV